MDATEAWAGLRVVAPHSAAIFDVAATSASRPVLHDIPTEALALPEITPLDPTWPAVLDRPTTLDPQISVRELLLRYALSRAIVDQGSDILGVEMWHRRLVERAYASGIAFLHRPTEMVQRYSEVLDLADSIREEVTEERASKWAEASPTRSAGRYSVFTVDGMRGGTQAHWFLSARFFPALLLAGSVPGGLTRLVFEAGSATERPVGMARRLRNDRKYGLGWCLGDKAADLFAKWVVGTLALTPPYSRPWTPGDTVIPMDQRIGRVMMRTGFMDEFFNVAYLVRHARNIFTDLEPTTPIPADQDEIPDKRFHLTVMNFRRAAVVRSAAIKARLDDAWRSQSADTAPRWQPQEVVSILCRTITAATSYTLTPVGLDDLFMEIGETWCTDQSPNCSACPFAAACQANNAPAAGALKKYIT